MTEKPASTSLLFVCTHTAGRSTLGAALGRHQAGDRAASSQPMSLPRPSPASTLVPVASGHRQM